MWWNMQLFKFYISELILQFAESWYVFAHILRLHDFHSGIAQVLVK